MVIDSSTLVAIMVGGARENCLRTGDHLVPSPALQKSSLRAEGEATQGWQVAIFKDFPWRLLDCFASLAMTASFAKPS